MEAKSQWMRSIAATFVWCLILLVSHIFAQTPSLLLVGPFSTMQEGGEFTTGWKPWKFTNVDRLTRYSLVREDGTVVIKAVAEASASGLIREGFISPSEYPVLTWRWKVEKGLSVSNVRSKEEDDYAARIYVSFEYDPGRLGLLDRAKYGAVRLLYGQAPPLRVINYVWENKTPKGTVVSSPYTDWVRLIVVENGASPPGRWIVEERNIVEDYRRAFGEEPGKITGIALMSDADNTGGQAVAWYGDIVMKKAAGSRALCASRIECAKAKGGKRSWSTISGIWCSRAGE